MRRSGRVPSGQEQGAGDGAFLARDPLPLPRWTQRVSRPLGRTPTAQPPPRILAQWKLPEGRTTDSGLPGADATRGRH